MGCLSRIIVIWLQSKDFLLLLQWPKGITMTLCYLIMPVAVDKRSLSTGDSFGFLNEEGSTYITAFLFSFLPQFPASCTLPLHFLLQSSFSQATQFTLLQRLSSSLICDRVLLGPPALASSSNNPSTWFFPSPQASNLNSLLYYSQKSMQSLLDCCSFYT